MCGWVCRMLIGRGIPTFSLSLSSSSSVQAGLHLRLPLSPRPERSPGSQQRCPRGAGGGLREEVVSSQSRASWLWAGVSPAREIDSSRLRLASRQPNEPSGRLWESHRRDRPTFDDAVSVGSCVNFLCFCHCNFFIDYIKIANAIGKRLQPLTICT